MPNWKLLFLWGLVLCSWNFPLHGAVIDNQKISKPEENLALNKSGEGYPKASASFSDRSGGVPKFAIDGKTNFRPTPLNRWTSFGSSNTTDWIEIDFGSPKMVGRAELFLYNDREGVQPPASYSVQVWMEGEWKAVLNPKRTPEIPTGNKANSVSFSKVTTSKVRILFTHQRKAWSGLTELQLWTD